MNDGFNRSDVEGGCKYDVRDVENNEIESLTMWVSIRAVYFTGDFYKSSTTIYTNSTNIEPPKFLSKLRERGGKGKKGFRKWEKEKWRKKHFYN